MKLKQRKPVGFILTSLASIVLIIFLVASFVAAPLLVLLIGMALGSVLELFTGDYVIQAFNALGLTQIENGDLPKVFGLLALIVVMFRGNIGKDEET